MGWMPGWGTRIPHALTPKNQNIKSEATVYKLIKDQKWSTAKKKKKKKKKNKQKNNTQCNSVLKKFKPYNT